MEGKLHVNQPLHPKYRFFIKCLHRIAITDSDFSRSSAMLFSLTLIRLIRIFKGFNFIIKLISTLIVIY